MMGANVGVGWTKNYPRLKDNRYSFLAFVTGWLSCFFLEHEHQTRGRHLKGYHNSNRWCGSMKHWRKIKPRCLKISNVSILIIYQALHFFFMCKIFLPTKLGSMPLPYQSHTTCWKKKKKKEWIFGNCTFPEGPFA